MSSSYVEERLCLGLSVFCSEAQVELVSFLKAARYTDMAYVYVLFCSISLCLFGMYEDKGVESTTFLLCSFLT